jgi:dTDP-4-amino-4,6-dideoxygalactose transaminase
MTGLKVLLSGFNYDKKIGLYSIFQDTMENTSFINGASIKKFEQQFAKHSQGTNCIATGNCTDSLRMCLQAYGIGPNDRVAVPSFTWLSTAEVVKQLWAEPVFVDVDDTMCMSPTDLERTLSSQECKAVIAVDLFGNVADIDQLKQIATSYDCAFIQDSAQSTGALYKNKGLGACDHPVCYSFYPTKNLGTWGDAGAVVCDIQLGEKIKQLRNHGQGAEKFISKDVGWNSRMDSIHADILLNKLPHLDKWNSKRSANAKMYQDNIRIPHKTQTINTDCKPVWHQYVITVSNPKKIFEALENVGVQSRIYYKTPIHKLPTYATGQDLPRTDILSQTNISIPVHQDLTEDNIGLIIDTVNKVEL